MLFGGGSVAMRYGNWVGPGWWGGSESSTRPGALAPVDDLDAVAQKHDFGYQLAEELGRGRPGVEGAYKLMADMIAIRDAKALDPDPSRWSHPPRDAALAKSFVNRLIISFEEWQTRYNRYKSRDMTPDDITDLDTINRALDDQPDMAKFEAMQKQRVRQWDQQHATWQTQKQPTPTKTPKPGPDCTKGSFMERTLCLHKADPNAKPPKQ